MSDFDKSNPLKPTIVKDPDAVLDYTLDLTAWLADVTDTLTSHATSATGVEVASSSIVDGKRIVLWVRGGVVNQTGSVTVHFTTTGGREDDRTLFFKIRQR